MPVGSRIASNLDPSLSLDTVRLVNDLASLDVASRLDAISQPGERFAVGTRAIVDLLGRRADLPGPSFRVARAAR